jgi:hypothetical protein
MLCCTGKHDWLDPISASRCCVPGWKRVLRVSAEDRIDGDMPDGMTRSGLFGARYVWRYEAPQDAPQESREMTDQSSPSNYDIGYRMGYRAAADDVLRIVAVHIDRLEPSAHTLRNRLIDLEAAIASTLTATLLAWHFFGDRLRDGSPIPPDGEWLEVEPPIELCVRGLHASLEPFDALQYAPGPTLARVEVAGDIVIGDDKLVATRRRIIARIDATELLRADARASALSVAHLWDMPPIVREYLETGREELRDAARAATRVATWSATEAAWAAWNSAEIAADDVGAAFGVAAREAALAAHRTRFNAAVYAAFNLEPPQ